jgi:hypothetical protein
MRLTVEHRYRFAGYAIVADDLEDDISDLARVENRYARERGLPPGTLFRRHGIEALWRIA